MKERKALFSVTASDCKFDYYRGRGKGGQKKNVTDNCVRCTHIESGAVGKSEQGRSQRKNKELAFKRMAESKEFKNWLHLECSRRAGELSEIERKVERSMRESNLKIEGKENGKWKVINR